jgi:hypothetical protein
VEHLLAVNGFLVVWRSFSEPRVDQRLARQLEHQGVCDSGTA